MAPLLRESGEGFDAVEALVLDLTAREPRPCRRRLAAPVLAGEQAAREREVRDVRDAELTAEREHVDVVAALEQAVAGSAGP